MTDFETWWADNGLKDESFIDKKYCGGVWKSAFAAGYEMGKSSRIGLNGSGCVCVFDDDDKIVELCKAHADLIRKGVEKDFNP